MPLAVQSGAMAGTSGLRTGAGTNATVTVRRNPVDEGRRC